MEESEWRASFSIVRFLVDTSLAENSLTVFSWKLYRFFFLACAVTSILQNRISHVMHDKNRLKRENICLPNESSLYDILLTGRTIYVWRLKPRWHRHKHKYYCILNDSRLCLTWINTQRTKCKGWKRSRIKVNELNSPPPFVDIVLYFMRL